MEAAAAFASKPSPPLHVAIIMDGNGRWAKARGLRRIVGHQQGAEAVRRTVKHCRELGVSYLTIYAFSSENWKRPPTEVDDLMGLMRLYLRRELDELVDAGVRMRFIGDRHRLPDDIIALVNQAEQRTRTSSGLTLTVALNYGGRREIVEAAQHLARDAAAGLLDPGDIDEKTFADRLATNGLPEPDLLIRTSGEQRISNFLLWQLAYTELVFIPAMWPDFTKQHLEDAINEFHRRERRYGASSG
ncbi:MAG: isoprenyl transferase [Proteobacteria bacterium]|nr:isoprenyl transferase [Pseudomonadota bacterium]